MHDEYLRISSSLSDGDEDPIEWDCKLNDIKIKENENKLDLQFENKNVISDLVIGCDGIYSTTRKFKYDEKYDTKLNYLGIILILGISHTNHFLANQRIFQTMDGNTRMYAMPFLGDNPSQNIMWQISFPLPEKDAQELKNDPNKLKEEVMKRFVQKSKLTLIYRFYKIIRCSSWHDPIPTMIESTLLENIMGFCSYDRDSFLPPKATSNNFSL